MLSADLVSQCVTDPFVEVLMKRLNLFCAAAVLFALAGASLAHAADSAKTITGKSDCATCSGVTSAGHSLMLVDAKGMRWVLSGDSESYKAAQKARMDDKKMTATLASDPVVKTDDKGKEYKEAKVSDVKIES